MMMAFFSYLLLVGTVGLRAVHAQTCVEKYPIYVDFHNRSVTGGGEGSQYGSFIGVGVPSQNQSIVPSFTRNETSFAARGFCDSSTISNCIERSGGTVDFNTSAAWREDSSYRSTDSSSLGNTSVRGADDIHLWVHYFDPGPAVSVVNVTATPVEYVQSGDQLPNVVGLGSASTLMQSLVDQKHISARTFSLMYGDGMPRGGPGQYNGSLTFGGYDSARMSGRVHTYRTDMSQADFLPVSVQDIILDDPSNSTLRNRSILNNGAAFEARITTDQYPMRLPRSVTRNFADILDATPSTHEDGSLQAPSFAGVMRIRLSDGFEITLPSEAVVQPQSGLTPVQDNTDDNGPFYLSIAWLSQVILTVDYDAQQFHLAQAILNDTYIVPTTLCAGATPIPFNYGPKNSNFVKHGMIGAVLGGVIGGVAGVIAFVWSFVWWRRRRLIKALQKDRMMAATYKDDTVEDGEMEMQDLASKKKTVPFAWVHGSKGKGKGKGKGPMPVPQDESTAYQGRSSSEDVSDGNRV